MVIYNPKDWFSLIFKFHKSDTFRRLIWVMLAVAVYTAIVVYLELDVLHVTKSNSAVMYQLLGFVISLLLVFRTNTAYDRWWEGRKQWGALVNASRNLHLKVKNLVPDDAPEKERFVDLVSRYSFVLRHHLRDEKWEGMKEDIHQPNAVANELYRILGRWMKEHKIPTEMMLAIEDELKEFTDICGACERIRKTPIPYSYNIFIKKFIFAYVMTLPFGFVVEYGYGIIPIVLFTLYALASLELIAEEIEDPFGIDDNDLPLDSIVETIAANAKEIG